MLRAPQGMRSCGYCSGSRTHPMNEPEDPSFPRAGRNGCTGSSQLTLGAPRRLLPGLTSELQGQRLVAACSVNTQRGWGCTRPRSFPGSGSEAHLAHGRFWCLSRQAWHVDLEVGSPGPLRGIPSCLLWVLLGDTLGPPAPGPCSSRKEGRLALLPTWPWEPGWEQGPCRAGGVEEAEQRGAVLGEKTDVWRPILLSPHPLQVTFLLAPLEEHLLGLSDTRMRRKC